MPAARRPSVAGKSHGMLRQLVVLGTTDDPHVVRVVAKTRKQGVPSVVLDHNERSRLVTRQGSDGSIVVGIDDVTIRPTDHPVVWNRQKLRPEIGFFFPHRQHEDGGSLRLSERTLSFLSNQWRGMYGILLGLFEADVINSPAAVLRFSNKLIQQSHAAAVGFNIPPSIVANQRKDVVAFVTSQGCCVAKSLGDATVKTDALDEEDLSSSLMTMDVAHEHLAATTDEQVRLAPCFLQKKVQKAHELRVVFVDDTAFAFRVDSQQHKLTSTDWRYGNSFLPFEPVQLPGDVLDMVTTLMDRSGLKTGSMDLIVDTHGAYWFLEVNQDGAWGWLDDIVGGKIGDAFASAFRRAAAS